MCRTIRLSEVFAAASDCRATFDNYRDNWQPVAELPVNEGDIDETTLADLLPFVADSPAA